MSAFAQRPAAAAATSSGGAGFFDAATESTTADFTPGPLDAAGASLAFGHLCEETSSNAAPSKPFGDLVPKLRDPSTAFPGLAHPNLTVPPLDLGNPAFRPTPGLIPPTDDRLRITPPMPKWAPKIPPIDLDGRNTQKPPPEGAHPPRPNEGVEKQLKPPGSQIGPWGIPIPFDVGGLFDRSKKK
jgi:hypothetical protein